MPIPVLIVGAGPTGLTLAAQLHAFGVEFRIIDRTPEAAHESRALAVQARTLEILQSLGLGERLAGRGNPSARLALHFERGRAAEVELGGFAANDTRFPFILFVSQAETEALLGDHLARVGLTIERGVELVGLEPENGVVHCRLRRNDEEEALIVQYVVGCDGAHSAVRKQAGIAFEGDAYLQDFMLGDVDADGPIEADVLHSFAARGYVAMFFPLRAPAKWRVIAIGSGASRARTNDGVREESLTRGDLSLHDLQVAVDGATNGTIRLRDPLWLTHFRLHHRQARTYRKGHVFLAGDAAHIHSPVGAQGMNTGMQDAWNLGWKLALVALGRAEENLLDTYETERWPVGRNLLRYTDRLFSVFVRVMSSNPLAAWFRRTIVARVIRTRGAATTRSITSTRNSLPIQNLRGLHLLNDNSGMYSASDPVQNWTGPFAANAAFLWHSCQVAPFGSVPGYPNVWWGACNTSSLFVADSGSRWVYTTNDPTLNEDMEVYVR